MYVRQRVFAVWGLLLWRPRIGAGVVGGYFNFSENAGLQDSLRERGRQFIVTDDVKS